MMFHPVPISPLCATFNMSSCNVWVTVLGSVLASLSIMWPSFILMISISHYLLTHKDAPWVKNVFAALRPAIIGLIAAAALLLMNKENFGTPAQSIPYFIMSIALCVTVFFATLRYKGHPILAMLAGSWD